MAFVDGDKATCEPRSFLCSRNVQIIVATSPKGAQQSWVKQASNHTVFIKLLTSLWSPVELFLTGLVSAFLSFKASTNSFL
jgi:hypothetical protein